MKSLFLMCCAGHKLPKVLVKVKDFWLLYTQKHEVFKIYAGWSNLVDCSKCFLEPLALLIPAPFARVLMLWLKRV